MQRVVAHQECYKRHIMRSSPSVLLTYTRCLSLASVPQFVRQKQHEPWYKSLGRAGSPQIITRSFCAAASRRLRPCWRWPRSSSRMCG